ncbi:choice-of-anchor U domain-containing protein [Verminephrobacter aporrectodeae]|uniref:choice-of-anchor U domain-containing protein n=1 Tax=Verminephrobacter aporrectodeae TaxID=1110389 RepID=UPI002244A4F5|nr:choice-of-anchor U domain-containing protein [Verminephrobacter aporrectodeae]MCW8177524.1 hypothetical protein [Verminephrobacter aporrectodeae subsp. tuberculatae]MCW8204950.1 hypothetical protein [Verminephrobacter aporrectodeae subsp. tuberculatae]
MVSSAAGTATTVTDAVVNATAKTVTLTLSRAVTRGGADHQLRQACNRQCDPGCGRQRRDGLQQQDGTGTWASLASGPSGGKMVNEGERLRLDFSTQDGGPFDADGKADGVITAPGAAANRSLSLMGLASDGAHGGFWF